jgi:hypothetical protein
MTKIYAALTEDINFGWVWVGDFKGVQRSVVKLEHRTNNKSVHCEVLKIDTNFKKRYEQGNTNNIQEDTDAIVLNEWYRSKLGIRTTQVDEPVQVTVANGCLGKFCACIDHPQVVVRLATWLGVISVMLGIIGIIN